MTFNILISLVIILTVIVIGLLIERAVVLDKRVTALEEAKRRSFMKMTEPAGSFEEQCDKINQGASMLQTTLNQQEYLEKYLKKKS